MIMTLAKLRQRSCPRMLRVPVTVSSSITTKQAIVHTWQAPRIPRRELVCSLAKMTESALRRMFSKILPLLRPVSKLATMCNLSMAYPNPLGAFLKCSMLSRVRKVKAYTLPGAVPPRSKVKVEPRFQLLLRFLPVRRKTLPGAFTTGFALSI